eukprot:EG_transcript_18885
MISSGPWLRLQLHLKVRNTLRKRARRALQHRAQRAETLDSWFKFWCAAEAKIQQSFRQQLQSPVTLQEVRRGQRGTIARATTPVADALKVQVIWELYWLLRAQHAHRLKLHRRRLSALLAHREVLGQQRSPRATACATVDFWQGEATSLRAVNAAFFIHSLQEPKFHYAVGRDIKVTELLRLANANLEAADWVMDSPRGPHGCPTLLAFLNSPLLTEPQWLKGRCKLTSVVIPPRTWDPLKPSVGPTLSPTSTSLSSSSGRWRTFSQSSTMRGTSHRDFRCP